MRVYLVLCAIACSVFASTDLACAQSGTQVINGTKVFTQVFQADGIAMFSNDCGSQILSQRELQQGAIPNLIIPCPRPEVKARLLPKSPSDNFSPEEIRKSYSKFMDAWKKALDEQDAAYEALVKGDYREAAYHSTAASVSHHLNSIGPGYEYVKSKIKNIDDLFQYDDCLSTVLNVIVDPINQKYDERDCKGQHDKPNVAIILNKMRVVQSQNQ